MLSVSPWRKGYPHLIPLQLYEVAAEEWCSAEPRGLPNMTLVTKWLAG